MRFLVFLLVALAGCNTYKGEARSPSFREDTIGKLLANIPAEFDDA